jgi:hypothetical protein
MSHPSAGIASIRRAGDDRGDVINETADPRSSDWASFQGDPSADRIMLAIQYAVAIIAVLAAGLLSLVH